MSLPDEGAREAARSNLSRSLLVEASAGTGKTTTLISRVLALVLEAGVPLPRVVALTFTEKAASEMRVRLEAALEKERAGEGPRAERAARAHLMLPLAEIGTLHSFCARLLRERPVEAGVDPDFSTPDEPVGVDLLRELFDEWLLEEAAREGSPAVALLRAGAEPAALRRAAEELYGSRALLMDSRIPDDVAGEARAHLGRLARRLRELLRAVPPGLERDPKAVAVRHAAQGLESLAAQPVEAMAVHDARDLRLDLRSGARDLWDEAARARLEEVREELRRLPDFLAQLPLQPALRDLALSLLSGLFPRVEERKRRQGLLDYDDLLVLARRLLRASPSSREHFRRRLDALIVDEFQDTDPLQAEIVFRLAAGEPQDPERWDDLVPRPGALFLVGDPKQSIYRFRGADVETYRSVRDRFPRDARLGVSVNFRSDPSILTFVNALSRHLLVERREEPWQVGDAPLVPPPGTPSGEERVLFLPPPALEPQAATEEAGGGEEVDEPEGPAEERAIDEREAEAVADLVLTRLRPGGEPFSRCAVLVYRNETVEVFQEVFQRRGIPVVVEGGRSYFRREETAAVLTALRAVDDPSDAVAFVATLKSFLFGFTDLELVEAAEAGARFDDRATLPRPDAGGPPGLITAAAALLDRLHAARHERPVAETLLHLLRSRLAFVSARHGAVVNGLQAESNLERLVQLARELDREGLSFPRALDRLRRRLADPVAEPRAFAEEEDAVRLTTIHKAKGLEYPVVVVAELARKKPLDGRRDQSIRYDRAGGSWALDLRVGDLRVGTPGFLRLKEADDERTRAEARRLLYVALTRARERLVLSWYRKRTRRADGGVSDPLLQSVLGPVAFAARERSILSPLVTWLAESSPAGEEAAPADATLPASELVEALAARDRDLEELAGGRARVLAGARRQLRRAGERAGGTGTEASLGEASLEDVPAPDRERPAGSAALQVGIAVHVAMERLLAPEAGSEPPRAAELSSALLDATAELPHAARAEVRQLVERLLADPIVARARAARRRFVEMPILFREGDGEEGALVEGKLDLLFEEEDGWVIVDWKTDRLEEGEDLSVRRGRYAPQLDAYAAGLRAVLGPGARVKECRLVFARSPLTSTSGQLDAPGAAPARATGGSRSRQLSFDFEG